MTGLGGPDIVGLAGVGLMLIAYAGAALGKIDATRSAALGANVIGAGLVLYSLIYDWNIASFVMEAAWLLVALAGLIRIAVTRRR